MSAANLNIDAEAVVVLPGVSLVVLQNEIPEAVNLAIAVKARAVGAQVWLNAAPARRLSDAMVEAVDLMVVNRVEAGFYEGALAGVDVLTTLGPEGVMYRGQHFPGHRVDVVSTHGAGDMFVGALAARVAGGVGVSRAIRFAQAAAALHVAADTAGREGLTAADVERFVAAREAI